MHFKEHLSLLICKNRREIEKIGNHGKVLKMQVEVNIVQYNMKKILFKPWKKISEGKKHIPWSWEDIELSESQTVSLEDRENFPGFALDLICCLSPKNLPS